MNNKKIGIVLVNYNGSEFLNQCIDSIKSSTYENYKIILVDNASTDKSIEKVRNRYSDIVIIEVGENCGIAKGNNIGIKKALELECEYILLLNNDTEIHREMIENMLEKAREDIMITCKMYYYNPNNIIWCAGGEIDWTNATTIHYGDGKVDNVEVNISRFVEYTPTCCLLVHNTVFKKVGFMDENYFLYYDDVDFIVRAKQKGIKVWYESTAKLWHKVSSSSGGSRSPISIYYGDRNRLYFINKFYKSKLRIKLYFYITRVIRIIKYFVTDIRLFKISIRAIIDSMNGKMYRQDI